MTLLLATSLFIIGACGSNSKPTEKTEASKVTSSSTNSSEGKIKEKEMKTSIFLGTLAEDAKMNDDKSKTVRLVLEKVEAVDDPEKIIGMMEKDGVILNAPKEVFLKDLDENQLLKGDTIQFSLEGLPIMTMSIPPQIPGNSIVSIEKIN